MLCVHWFEKIIYMHMSTTLGIVIGKEHVKMQNRYTYCYKLIIQILQITVEVVDITQPQQLPLKSAHLCNKQVLL